MAYTRVNWENSPSTNTPLNAANLNNMDSMLAELYEEVQRLKNNTGGGGASFPVGYILMSATNVNPSTFTAGTWEPWGTGRVPVAVDAGNSNFDEPEKIGGAELVALDTAHLPAHTHSMAHTHTMAHTHSFTTGSPSSRAITGYVAGHHSAAPSTESNYFQYLRHGTSHSVTATISGAEIASHTHSGTTKASSASNTGASSAANTGSTGSGTGHNNLQPYITCYMWKRTA